MGRTFHEIEQSGFFLLKKVALFGTGDQKKYPGSFVDAMGEVYRKIANAGANVIGGWSSEGYQFGHSSALVDGKFAGLALDEHNQAHKTFGRIDNWVTEISAQLTH